MPDQESARRAIAPSRRSRPNGTAKLARRTEAFIAVLATSETMELPEISARLRALLEGETASAAWLFDIYAPRLLRRLKQRYAYLGESAAEDLLQETFVLVLRDQARLLRQALSPALATELALERFLWDQACGLASNRRRAARRKIVPLTGDFAARGGGPEQRAVERDLLVRLLGCLRGRGRRPLLYFKLRFQDGLTPDEIARATGWSRKATYKARQGLNDALRWCREALGMGT